MNCMCRGGAYKECGHAQAGVRCQNNASTAILDVGGEELFVCRDCEVATTDEAERRNA